MEKTQELPHAYQNADFLESRDGRSLRIMSGIHGTAVTVYSPQN